MSTRLDNNVQGVLSGAIASGATAMNVTLDTGSNSYPASIDSYNPMYLTLSDPTSPMLCEIVRVTAVSGSNVTTMTRGQRGTAAVGWAAGARVSLNAHAQDFPSINDDGDLTVAADVSAVNGTFTGIAQLAAGSVAAPSLHLGDTTTGLYRRTTNEVSITISGEEQFRFSSGTFRIFRSSGFALINMYSYREATAQAGLRIFAARGTRGTPGYCASGDNMFQIRNYPWDGGSHATETARIRFRANQAHASGALGTRIEIETTANDSATQSTALTIGADKSLKVVGGFAAWNATPPASKPTVTDLATLITALASYGLVTDGT